MKRKSIHWTKKMAVAARQRFRCAGNPETCPCHRLDHGVFQESGFEVDHVVALCDGGDDSLENLRALCACCHSIVSREQRLARLHERNA